MKRFYIIAAFLFIVPFFWLKPGTVDLGGDSSRLYFYDPIHYLKSYPLYVVVPNGFNTEINPSYLLPFTLFLAFLKKLFVSSYLLTTVFNSLKLVGAFLSVAGIVTTLLRAFPHKDTDRKNIYFASFVAAIFYTLSPALTEFGWWTRALYTHHLFFLNPLMFLLLLKYVITKNFRYVLLFLLISFVFSTNFFLSPYFFSFYPLTIVFLGIFAIFVLRTRLVIKEILFAAILYILVHASHVLSNIIDLFQVNSQLHDLVFLNESTVRGGLNYFLTIAGSTKFAHNLFGLAQQSVSPFSTYTLWVFAPVLITLGLLFSAQTVKEGKMKKTFLLLILFWLSTLFFATAKITNVGLEFYKLLFTVPGFSMFRNYVGQFLHVYIFFYALIVGFSSFYIFTVVENYKRLIITIGIAGVCIIGAFPFLRGDAIRIPLNPGAKEKINIGVRFDPAYEDILKQIRNDPLDSKYLLLPIDDSGAQVLRGVDGGYMGPPTIAYLTGKSVFSGIGGLERFQEVFIRVILNKDYEGINNLLLLLNIRYLFHNSDPSIYGENFSAYPYGYARKIMPLSQDIYGAFLEDLSTTNKTTLGGSYHIYTINEDVYTPHLYIATKTYYVDAKNPQAILSPFLLTKDKRLAVFPSTDNTQESNENILLLGKRESTLLQAYSQKKDAILVADSVDPNTYALLHPFLVLQEKTANEKANVMLRMDFDDHVYKAQAHIKFLKDMTSDAFANEVIKYDKAIRAIFEDIQKKEYILYSSLLNKARLGHIAAGDASRFKKAILENKTIPQGEKEKLRNNVDEMFSSLQRDLYGSFSPDELSYTVDVSTRGKYALYVDREAKDGYFVPDNPKKLDVYLTNSFPLGLFQEIIGTSVNLQNLSASANIKAEGTLLAFVRNTLGDLVTWGPNTRYIISFEYVLKNNPASGWKTYKMLVETGDDVSSALLLFLNNPNIPSEQVFGFSQGADIDVRNLVALELKHPQVLLVKEEQKTVVTPKVVFTKINPTKYIVSVKGAKESFVLVFQDAFNDKWKLFLQDKEREQKNIVKEYYNGDIGEAAYQNSFFDFSLFENWNKKALAENKHFMVNGYANSWFVEPSDTNGATDYTLILEMTSQRQMYGLFLVSVITATLIAFRLLWKR